MAYYKNIERSILINSLVTMVLEKCMPTKTVLEFLMNEVGYEQAAAYKILGEARSQITKIQEKSQQEAFEEACGQLEEELLIAKKEKNRKHWLAIRKELDLLRGLNRPTKLDISHTGEVVINTIRITELDTKKKKDE